MAHLTSGWHSAGADYYHVRHTVDYIGYNLLKNTPAHSIWSISVYDLILIYALGAGNS